MCAFVSSYFISFHSHGLSSCFPLLYVLILFICHKIFYSSHGINRLISTGLSLLGVFILNSDAICSIISHANHFVYHLFDAHISNVANLIWVVMEQYSFFRIPTISHDVNL